MRVVVLALGLVVFPVGAQSVQKCVGRNGDITLTSGTCPEGQREVASVDARPERETAEQARRRAELRQWEQQQAARRAAGSVTYYNAPTRTVSQSRHQRCDAAKAWRDAQVERVGLRRTHAQLRQWDDYVYQQCK